MTQKVTLSITAAQYNGNMKTLMNTAYGIVLAIYVPASGGGSWRQGCSVTSAVSSRRTVVIQFTATVSPAYATTAQANSKSMSAGNLQAAASSAKTDLGAAFASLTIPTVSNVQAPTCTGTNCGTTSGASSTSASMLALLAAIGICKILQH
jgi:hypothetical protein